MAEESRSISGSVRTTYPSAEIAAFELMKHLAQWENLTEGQKDRKYWLTLYRQCYKATHGQPLKHILTEE
jgi:hypothetical protein